jgi:hypothetical protein
MTIRIGAERLGLAVVTMLAASGLIDSCRQAAAAEPLPAFSYGTASFSGVWPHLASVSDSYSEAGIGAVVPWADRLWYVSYVAHKAGSGVGLYEVDSKLGIRRRPESVVGTHANRMIHRETNQLIIGPYAIDAKGNVRAFKDLVDERLTGTMRHLTDPAHKVYFQAMEGNFYEGDLRTLSARKLYDLTQVLAIGGRTHFKGAYTAQGRVVVANNSYFEEDQRDGSGRGRLAEWDGHKWTILERTAFCDVTTAAGIEPVPDDQSPLWANGWDRRSVVLKVLCEGRWHTYRLPKGSQSYDQAWCTEWPRIRQVAPGQLLLDMHGLYYKMSPEFRPGHAAGLAPYVSHLKMTPDFAPWKDRLVFAGNENSSMGHRHRTGGQPQANLWFGSMEEIGRWGAPAGWGGPWLGDPVKAGVPSDPFLVQGFSRRVLHLAVPAMASRGAVFTLEVDRDGSGTWAAYKEISVGPGDYAYHVFPEDFQGCWVRITPDRDTVATAQFHFGPHEDAAARAKDAAIFAAIPPATADGPRIGGALLPFANRLWFASYVDPGKGGALRPGGFYEIDKDVKFVRRAESIPGIFDNRKMVGGLLSIGPHLVGEDGTVRTFTALKGQHLVASIRRPDSAEKMYFLTADGSLLEADLKALEVKPGPDVPAAVGLKNANLRFRGGHATGKTVIVAATAREENTGLLAEWDGKLWKVIDRAAYAELSNLGAMSEQVVATGWDGASTILMAREGSRWVKYRLPKASEDYCSTRRGQWPRIREVVTERMLFDAGGLFYEVSGLPYAWSVKPVAAHGRNVPDYCSWRGLLVLAGGDPAVKTGGNYVRGGDGAGLWFGTVDDLWKFGKPRGVGGPWRKTPVKAGQPSDPYLMANFDEKRVTLSHDADAPVRFTIEVDFTVQRRMWKPYETIAIEPGKSVTHDFPKGYLAHWVRVKTDRDCRATAWFVYE